MSDAVWDEMCKQRDAEIERLQGVVTSYVLTERECKAEIERLRAAIEHALYVLNNNPNAYASEVALEFRRALKEKP